MARRRHVVVLGPEEIREMNFRSLLRYRDILTKYEGFRACFYRSGGLREYRCGPKTPCCDLVLLYAKMGLHRYNLLHGKDLQLLEVRKYNKSLTAGCVISSYYITCRAKDPAPRGSVRTFQAVVREGQFNRFVLTCRLARFKGETNKKSITTGGGNEQDERSITSGGENEQDERSITSDGENEQDERSITSGGENEEEDEYEEEYPEDNVLGDKALSEFMPELPSVDPFKDDTNRFYVLKESEVQENDWIRLYLELAVAKTIKKRGETHSLTTLKLLKVATESTRDLPPFKKGLAAFDATFYIRYEDSCEARVGKDVHRIALVRRILDDEEETLHLVGCHQSIAAMEAGS